MSSPAAGAEFLHVRRCQRATTIALVSASPSPEGSAEETVAVVDLGTNSTRLLITRLVGGRLEELRRESTVTSLGSGVDLTGALTGDAIDRTCEAVDSYREIWDQAGVRRVFASATSAARDASNGAAFVAEVRERFAIDARVLSGEEEAELVFRGATAGRPAEPKTLVIDIGGGSTEIVVGDSDGTEFHASMQMGVLRHSERHLSSDPPSPEELENLANEIRATIDSVTGNSRSIAVERAIAVAGTPAALAAIERGESNPSRDEIHGATLGLVAIQRSLSELSAMTHAERAEVPGLRPDRAPFILAGTVILIQVMRAFEVEEVEVSETDLMHGLALEALGA